MTAWYIAIVIMTASQPFVWVTPDGFETEKDCRAHISMAIGEFLREVAAGEIVDVPKGKIIHNTDIDVDCYEFKSNK